ncbi:hypothetical protein Dimus_038774 [Dionaea muscipula]
MKVRRVVGQAWARRIRAINGGRPPGKLGSSPSRHVTEIPELVVAESEQVMVVRPPGEFVVDVPEQAIEVMSPSRFRLMMGNEWVFDDEPSRAGYGEHQASFCDESRAGKLIVVSEQAVVGRPLSGQMMVITG